MRKCTEEGGDLQQLTPFFAAFALPVDETFTKEKSGASPVSNKIKCNEQNSKINWMTWAEW